MADPAPAELLEATLQANFAVICERWPAVAQALSEAVTAPFEAVQPTPGHSGPGSVRVDGLQLSSAYAPLAEAQLQGKRVPPSSPSATLYGLGLGELARTLLARPALRTLRVVLLNPGVAKVGLAFADQRDLLRDPRLELALAGDERRTSEPFAALPPALQLAQESALPLRDAVVTRLQEPFALQQLASREQALAQHIAQNEARVATDRDVGELFGSLEAGRALVVGPGPTLSAQFESILCLRRDATLIALSTAVPSLLAVGIVPDLVILIDPYSIHVLEPSAEQSFANVPLVYTPEVQGATLDAWPGPRLAAYLDRPRYAQIRSRLKRADLWTSGTVSHSAVDLAVQMGAREVVLFGLDFAYPGGNSHAAGNPDQAERGSLDRGRTLIDGHGQRIASDPNLITYLRDLEDYIAVHPEVVFLRADRRAASVRGAQWM